MNPYASFAPSPRRKRGLILTLAGSLLFHGSLIGVAAFWPTSPAPPVPGPTQIDFVACPEDPTPPLPPSVLPEQPDPVAPVLNAPEPVDNPPPVVEPDADSMTLATPIPTPTTRTPSHPASVPRANTTVAPGSLPAGASATGNHAASGHAGQTAARWNLPKPVYPPSLRLAHVQGNGSVRVTTDGSGRVVSATIVQSTGNALLDDHTCRAARSDWSGPPNAAISVPITYHLD